MLCKPRQNVTVEKYDDVIVNFASDTKLANDVYDYISSSPDVSNNNIVMKLAKDEIIVTKSISGDQDKLKQIIKKMICNYLGDHRNLKKYKIMEFENLIVVGILNRIEKISRLNFCEMCGYGFAHEEELILHRRAHGYGMF